MSEIMIEFETTKSSMSEIRPTLEAALQKQFPGGMLRRKWDGDVLVLSGPGASGSIIFENGKLVGSVNVADVTDDDLLGMIILGKAPGAVEA